MLQQWPARSRSGRKKGIETLIESPRARWHLGTARGRPRGLRARSPAGQGSEAVLGCEILNRMTP